MRNWHVSSGRSVLRFGAAPDKGPQAGVNRGCCPLTGEGSTNVGDHHDDVRKHIGHLVNATAASMSDGSR